MSRSYTSASGQRALCAFEVLGERPLDPIALETLRERLDASRGQALQAVKDLEAAGWAEQTPGGGWRLTPKTTQLSEQLRLHIGDLHRTYLEDAK